MPTLLEKIKSHCQSEITRLESEMAAFVEKFKQYPADALKWSQDIFRDAALLEANKRVVAQIDKGLNHDDLTKSWADHMHNMALYPCQSTSQAWNTMEQFRLAAIAHIIDVIKA